MAGVALRWRRRLAPDSKDGRITGMDALLTLSSKGASG
jgi:hypothetical protein